MKVDLKEIVPYVVMAITAAVGYGSIQKDVEGIGDLAKLADNNMNDIIVLKTQMNLLVTPDMKIVPSPIVNAKLDRVMRFMEEEKRRQEDRRRMEERLDEEEHRRYEEEDSRW